ncbi:hypothetical protein GCM10028824_11500 [Hymenobacter segetis]|uniref:Nuclear transport factor 2 family protein n=1 Tax=Hymenobacter segetis TaxID=2025509 RepID=A0ABU9LVX8_9BACT
MKIIIALLLIGFSFSTAFAQKGTGTSASNDKMKAMIIQLDKDWAAATLHNDMAFMKKFVADDCLFTEADGTVATKAEMLKDMESGASKTTANETSNYSVRFFGPDVAIIRHDINVAGMDKGKDTSGDYRRMHVFVRRNGQWVVVDSQSVRIGGKAMATK